MEKITGYIFANKLLCVEALQMVSPKQSVLIDNKHHLVGNNKRLAVLGDLTLDKLLGKLWYEKRNGLGNLPSHSIPDAFFLSKAL